MPNLKEIFHIEKPSYLWVADRPPLLGGVPQKLPIAEVEAKFKFIYTESILASDEIAELPHGADTRSELTHIVNRYASDANAVIDKLVLCNMGDNVGWGVFARQDIPANTVLAIYAGEKVKRDEQLFDEYGLESDDKNYTTSASQYGGIARFFQHAPLNPMHKARALARKQTASRVKALQLAGQYLQRMRESAKEAFIEMDSLEFLNPAAEKNMAWENTETENVCVSGVNMRIFSARQTIPAGEPITFSYGIGYWAGRDAVPELFERSGKIIDHSCYKRKYITVPAKLIQLTAGAATTEKERIYLYFTKVFLTYDLLRQFPVMLFPATQLFSNFDLRCRLVKSNALDVSFSPVVGDRLVAEFDRALQRLNPQIQAFYRDPRVDRKKASPIDIICRLQTIEEWIYFTKIVRAFLGQDMCKAFQATREVLIKDVNLGDNTDKIQAFISKLPDIFASAAMPTPDEVASIVAEAPEKNPKYFFTQPAPRERLTSEGIERLDPILRQFRL